MTRAISAYSAWNSSARSCGSTASAPRRLARSSRARSCSFADRTSSIPRGPPPKWKRLLLGESARVRKSPCTVEAILKSPVSLRVARIKAVSSFRHFILAGAHEADPDGQGRVVIPSHLREYATLGNEAVVIGNSDHLEVWEPGRWRAELARVQSGVENDLRDLGI